MSANKVLLPSQFSVPRRAELAVVNTGIGEDSNTLEET